MNGVFLGIRPVVELTWFFLGFFKATICRNKKKVYICNAFEKGHVQ